MDLVNLLRRLRKLWTKQEEHELPDSIVLFLREPHFFTKVELAAAGERDWGKPFDIGKQIRCTSWCRRKPSRC
jgi:hypothetical protein